MVAIIGRSAWGALPPHRDPGLMTKCDAIVIHHPVTSQPQTIDEAYDVVRSIDRYTMGLTKPDGDWLYSDIPYNFLVGPDCYFVGRGINANDGATDNTMETDTVSICVLGDYRVDLVDERYLRALRFTIDVCRSAWGRLPVVPHKTYYDTECPGPNLISLIPLLNGDDDMTPDEFFLRPLVLNSGDPPTPYPTTVEGWFIFVHQEVQFLRMRVDELAAKGNP